ncbi:uncharacterized mitochondrial protein-like protein [Tanacetum coccineum]
MCFRERYFIIPLHKSFSQQASMPTTHDDEDLLQIDEDAMEEIDIRAQHALWTRWDLMILDWSNKAVMHQYLSFNGLQNSEDLEYHRQYFHEVLMEVIIQGWIIEDLESQVTHHHRGLLPQGLLIDHIDPRKIVKSIGGNPEEDLKDYAIIDDGMLCEAMTGDKDMLSDFKVLKVVMWTFGNDSKWEVSQKGTIKTFMLRFEKVSYVEELKFNILIFVDQDLVILRALERNDVYSLDLKNIIPWWNNLFGCKGTEEKLSYGKKTGAKRRRRVNSTGAPFCNKIDGKELITIPVRKETMADSKRTWNILCDVKICMIQQFIVHTAQAYHPEWKRTRNPRKSLSLLADESWVEGHCKKNTSILSYKRDFEELMQKEFKMSSMGELTFFLGLQVKQSNGGIFLSQDKYVKDILNKFDFRTIKPASTPIEAHKSLGKDEEGEDVDVHLYRIYDWIFQVTPKVSHLHAVKRIFRYLKHQPKLGLWYPKDSPFHLEAFSDSDYAGDNHDRRSTSGGCQYLGRRLSSGQLQKQTIVVSPLTVHTDDNVADLLTKGFDLARFNFLVVTIGMMNP